MRMEPMEDEAMEAFDEAEEEEDMLRCWFFGGFLVGFFYFFFYFWKNGVEGMYLYIRDHNSPTKAIAGRNANSKGSLWSLCFV